MMLVYLEPSSVLADRVMHAMDNPSPPPSPTLPLSFFDPYHTTTPQSPTDYQNDLFSLNMNSHPEHHDDNRTLPSTNIYSKAQISDSPHPNLPSQALQQDLISFDSVTILQPSKEANNSPLLKESVSESDPSSHCPISVKPPRLQSTFEIPDLVVEPHLGDLLIESAAAMDLGQTVGDEDSEIVLHNSESRTSQLDVDHVSPQLSNVEAPVRQPPRPRKSITPNLVPLPPVFLLPPSGARTQIKNKSTIDTFDECIDDSQEEQDSEEEIIQQVQTKPSTLWSARQRSPTRSPMSFNRVLGSLSPKSSDLLSKLAFTSTEEPNNITIGDGESSSDSQTPFTFSMFPTLPESMPPQTPSRSTGPIRFSSPTRSTSPYKMRLQTVAHNDPRNAPARRIPIEQGIAQGHVSPQKAAQLGFKSDGTPLTSIQTPARRVLVAEHSAVPVTRPGAIRFASPSKGKERERSIEPSFRPVVARRDDKEKIPGHSSTSSTVQPASLPFPLVASNPASSMSSPMVPELCQGNPPHEKPANVKSYLRQPTSRIPRIGSKPYIRRPALNAKEKNPSTFPRRTVDLAKVSLTDCWYNTLILISLPKSPQKSTTTESTSISLSTRSTTSLISRVKPTVSASTSLLKRKREVEKPSPVKPRVIPLRQVPKVVVPTASSSRTRYGPPNCRTIPQDSVPRPSRAVDVEPGNDPRPAETIMKIAETKESSPLPPGSPMTEDLPHNILEPQSKPGSIVSDNISTSDTSSTFNRRTTRSRRTLINEGSSRPLPARRKPPASSQSDDVFSGMSITALKDLTTSNTARNQQYLIAKLETELVRKEGDRPGSPAVKIRTIVQRQTEEKLKQRAERAIRRSRRSDGDMASSDIECSSDVGYSSPCEDHSGESSHRPLIKHRRGPGDEEDYETPERLDRHKTNLFVEADNHDGEPERRVKWDRGLFTTVYIDEVKLGTRQPLKENISLKGILAPTAKVCCSNVSATRQTRSCLV